jgi:hypothetical protein
MDGQGSQQKVTKSEDNTNTDNSNTIYNTVYNNKDKEYKQ